MGLLNDKEMEDTALAEERREARRKRRIRNEILVYLTSVLVLGAVAGGTFTGVRALKQFISDRETAKESTMGMEVMGRPRESVTRMPSWVLIARRSLSVSTSSTALLVIFSAITITSPVVRSMRYSLPAAVRTRAYVSAACITLGVLP